MTASETTWRSGVPDSLVAGQLTPARASSAGHRFMFVVLMLSAFSVFAPSVLLPMIREHTALLASEVRLAEEVAATEAELERRGEVLEAFKSDPQTIARLALLDLRYRRPDEVVLSVHPTPASRSVTKPTADTVRPNGLDLPPAWPSWSHSVETWASRQGLIDLFLDASLRPVLLLMSGGLLVAAFVLFVPRRSAISDQGAGTAG